MKRVLVVDDSLTVRMDLLDAFEESGLAAHGCASIQEARAYLSIQSVEAIVLDVILPDGNGVDFLQELRGSGNPSPVLMLSSEAEVKDRILGLQRGADEYVGKPYDRDFVVTRARELMKLAAAPDQDACRPGIVLIDDSPSVREDIGSALESAGYEVHAAPSGEEGLRLVARYRPSLVVVDGVLPGIDGATVIRRVRMDAALRGTPCLMLTGSEDGAAEMRMLDAGADAFVHKGEPTALFLARVAAVMRAAEKTVETTSSMLGPVRVLAVDDSPTYLHELAQALGGEGFDLIMARSGEEALEMLAVQTVDCILLDLMMPGLGGHETCRRIKAVTGIRDIPLIMITAQSDRDSMLEGLSAGADDYVSKSAEFEVLRARVRAQLRRKQFEDEKRRMHSELMERELEAAEARAARELAETRAVLIRELELKNKELESFSYSVSHDLRAPLRGIDGFCAILERDYAERLDEKGQGYLKRVRSATRRMGLLIDDLLKLSRIGRAPLQRRGVDLSQMAEDVLAELRSRDPERKIETTVEPGLQVHADPSLTEALLENLLGNAWKFTGQTSAPRVRVGRAETGGFYVADNGAGFEMSYADRLFQPFQRLHAESEFEGTGIGLATVSRIVTRHGGELRAEARPGQGATFYFSLDEKPGASGL